jgi:hypothetical protein
LKLLLNCVLICLANKNREAWIRTHRLLKQLAIRFDLKSLNEVTRLPLFLREAINSIRAGLAELSWRLAYPENVNRLKSMVAVTNQFVIVAIVFLFLPLAILPTTFPMT